MRMGHYDNVRDAMTSAFAIARSASTRLAASPWTADTAELVDYLFAKEGQHPSAADMDKALEVYRDILYNYEAEIRGNLEMSYKEVVSSSTILGIPSSI